MAAEQAHRPLQLHLLPALQGAEEERPIELEAPLAVPARADRGCAGGGRGGWRGVRRGLEVTQRSGVLDVVIELQ